MITTEFPTTATDVVTCEACWVELVEVARTTPDGPGRDLLCIPCAEAGYPTRVALFPPFGIYGLNRRKLQMNLEMGKHGTGSPKMPPNPGPALPSPPPTPTPGRPPV